jgi:hypothetical protein
VQAPIVSALIREFAKDIGYEKAIEIAKTAIKKDAIMSGKMLAEKFSGNSLSELSTIAKEVWAKDDAMNIRIVKQTEAELFFDVTECGYAEMYEKLGLRDLGCILSCGRDFSFLEGFNPSIELTRTKTIMEGKEICDFRYKVKS